VFFSVSKGWLTIRYLLFALVATVSNILAQELFAMLFTTETLWSPLMAGTLTGFAVKYGLDKRWIFFDRSRSYGHELSKIGLYGLFSVLTTVIFWSAEIAFWNVWKTDLAKYSGAVLGLAVGYLAKFSLDRKYVFRAKQT